jgi:hypothetical protein
VNREATVTRLPCLSLSALRGGEGRGEVGGTPASNWRIAHLTLPIADPTGPLPLPRRVGGEGKASGQRGDEETDQRSAQ